jgi:hypothetical protein
MASTSRKVLVDNEIDELLTADSESEFDYSDSSENSDELEDQAVADAIQQEEDDDKIVANVPVADSDESFFWQNMENYDGFREQFSELPGPRNQSVNVLDIVQKFLLFFTEDFVNNIVQETNTYAQQFICGKVFPFRSPARQWVPVTRNETYVVLALFLLMGI